MAGGAASEDVARTCFMLISVPHRVREVLLRSRNDLRARSVPAGVHNYSSYRILFFRYVTHSSMHRHY